MAREIKFTSFGVPYLLEFENVSFKPRQDAIDTSPSSSTSSFCYVESPPPPPPRFPSLSLPSPSSLFKRKNDRHSPTPRIIPSRRSNDSNLEPHLSPPAIPQDSKPLPPQPQSHVSEMDGIYVQSPPERGQPHMSRKQRLVHLQKIISVAVLDAGMSSSPGNTILPEKLSIDNTLHRSRGYKTPDALFCGTYGQLMTAFEAAGLSAIPCAGEGLPGYTRLGALFVARNVDGASGVQLRKITLWG